MNSTLWHFFLKNATQKPDSSVTRIAKYSLNRKEKSNKQGYDISSLSQNMSGNPINKERERETRIIKS